ncbi:MAG TPA: hypothetical protein VK556_08750 [Candidatus Udaeobacter sp.]|nr:hypothetical protein [Candidatus Udaeobacter sp.]
MRAPAVRQKREYRVHRRQQNHVKLQELVDGGHRRGLRGNTLVVIANGVNALDYKERLAVAHAREAHH